MLLSVVTQSALATGLVARNMYTDTDGKLCLGSQETRMDVVLIGTATAPRGAAWKTKERTTKMRV